MMFARYLTYLPGREQASKHAPRVSPHCERLARNIYEPRSHVAIATGRGCSRHGTARAVFPMAARSRSLSASEEEKKRPRPEPALAAHWWRAALDASPSGYSRKAASETRHNDELKKKETAVVSRRRTRQLLMHRDGTLSSALALQHDRNCYFHDGLFGGYLPVCRSSVSRRVVGTLSINSNLTFYRHSSTLYPLALMAWWTDSTHAVALPVVCGRRAGLTWVRPPPSPAPAYVWEMGRTRYAPHP